MALQNTAGIKRRITSIEPAFKRLLKNMCFQTALKTGEGAKRSFTGKQFQSGLPWCGTWRNIAWEDLNSKLVSLKSTSLGLTFPEYYPSMVNVSGDNIATS